MSSLARVTSYNNLRYQDGHQYQKIFDPLVQLEADYDKRLKESQTQDNIEVRWNVGSHTNIFAYFKMSQCEVKLGDQLRLRYLENIRKPWSGIGHVIKLPEYLGDEVGIQFKGQGAPISCHSNFAIDFLWKSTRYVDVSSYFLVNTSCSLALTECSQR